MATRQATRGSSVARESNAEPSPQSMSIRTVAGIALAVVVAVCFWLPLPGISGDAAAKWVLCVIAVIVAGALVGRSLALLLALGLGISVAAVWYVGYDASTTDSGPLDGAILGCIVAAVAAAAVTL